MEFLDTDKTRAWEGALNQGELENWKAIKKLLDGVGPEMRWRAAGWIMRKELEHARRIYRVALSIDQQPFKADMVRRNGVHYREAIERLEGRLAGLYDLALPLAELIDGVDRAYRAIVGTRDSLEHVSGVWDDSYQAEGRGIPGYDSDEGVARARKWAREAHARWKVKQAEADAKRQARGSKKGAKKRRVRKGDIPSNQTEIE